MNRNFLLVTLISGSILFSKILNAQTAALRIRTDPHILVHPNRSITFGTGTANPNNGQFSIEYWNGGLNFWKPWPTAYNGDYKLFISDWGCVGINCTPNVYNSINPNWDRLHVNGRIVSRGYFTWSDERTKCQVNDLNSSLDKILSLRTVTYFDKANFGFGEYSSDNNSRLDSIKVNPPANEVYCDSFMHFGLIAQEVKNIFPNLVSETKSGILALNYLEIVPILIKAIQEQQQTIQVLRQEIENWKGRSIDTNAFQTRLFQNTPNPFNAHTTFSYFIDENIAVSSASIEVRDIILGSLKSTIVLGDRSGIGQVDYDGSSLNTGYYINTLKVNGSIKDSKMFLKEQ